MLKRKIAATSLKIPCKKSLFSKNMKVFAFQLDLTYFDQLMTEKKQLRLILALFGHDGYCCGHLGLKDILFILTSQYSTIYNAI